MGDALLKAGGYAMGLGLLYLIYTVSRVVGAVNQGPMLGKYFAALAVAGGLGFVSARTLGTHVEGADPTYGGGERVADFTPSARELSGVGWFVFLLAAGASIAGLQKGRSSLSGRGARSQPSEEGRVGTSPAKPADASKRANSRHTSSEVREFQKWADRFGQGFVNNLNRNVSKDNPEQAPNPVQRASLARSASPEEKVKTMAFALAAMDGINRAAERRNNLKQPPPHPITVSPTAPQNRSEAEFNQWLDRLPKGVTLHLESPEQAPGSRKQGNRLRLSMSGSTSPPRMGRRRFQCRTFCSDLCPDLGTRRRRSKPP